MFIVIILFKVAFQKYLDFFLYLIDMIFKKIIFQNYHTKNSKLENGQNSAAIAPLWVVHCTRFVISYSLVNQFSVDRFDSLGWRNKRLIENLNNGQIHQYSEKSLQNSKIWNYDILNWPFFGLFLFLYPTLNCQCYYDI